MSVYLIDHPPAVRQYRSPRRASPSGVIVVHTAESFPDERPPDTGAENVAAFIARRTNYGSYHDVVDSDSVIQLVRYSDEAFHDATGSNPHSYGVSAATQAAKWSQLRPSWVDATVRNMAAASARYARWLYAQRGIKIPARIITRAQSENRVPGFISHAKRDPDRRTDPGALFPWNQFLGDFAGIMSGDLSQEDDMQLDERFTLSPGASANLNSLPNITVATALGYAAAGGFQTLQRLSKMQAQQKVILDAISAIPGVDTEALAAALNRVDAEEMADATVEEILQRLAE
jgi:N-acetyl-anhydromuramyl-L-alanine amidase AmpD